MKSLERWTRRLLVLLLIVAGCCISMPSALAAGPASPSDAGPAGHANLPPAPSRRDIHGDVPGALEADPTHRPLPAGSREAKKLAYARKHLDPFATTPAPQLAMPAGLSDDQEKIRKLRNSGKLSSAGVGRSSADHAPLSELPHDPGPLDASSTSSPAARPTTEGPPADAVAPAVATAPAQTVDTASTAQACASEPLCATYTLAAPNPLPSYLAPGAESVTIKNTGTKAWAAGEMHLDYHLYMKNSSGIWVEQKVQWLLATLPAVASGGTYTVTAAQIEPLLPGSYEVVWDLNGAPGLLSELAATSTQVPVPASAAVLLNLVHTAPWGGIIAPAKSGSTVDTLSPTLTAEIHDDGAKPFAIQMEVCAHGANPSDASCQTYTTPSTSGALEPLSVSEFVTGSKVVIFTDDWTPDSLFWNAQYDMYLRFEDGSSWLSWSDPLTFTPVVTQPSQVQLGSGNGYLDQQGVNMYLGQYAKSQEDLTLPSSPQPFSITRTYNSADNSDRAFGMGWSSLLDAQWVENSAKSLFTITLPDGSQRNYAKNPDGTWAGGWGFPVSPAISEPERKITIDGTTYTFDLATGRLTQLRYGPRQALDLRLDANGQATQVQDAYSSRSIYLTWSGGHVASESTGPNQTGLVWVYSHGSDGTLTEVCNPTPSPKECEDYAYTVDPNSQVSRLTRDSEVGGRNYVKIGYAGATLDFPNGYVNYVSLPDGTWTYSHAGNSDPSVASEVIATDPNNNPHYYSYGTNGELLVQWTNYETPQMSDQIAYGYDFKGQLAYEIDQNSVETAYTYDPVVGGLHTLNRWQDPNTIVNTYIERYVPAAGDTTDPRAGLPVKVADPNEHATTYEYDDQGDLIAQHAPSGQGKTATTTYKYACEDNDHAPAVVNDPSAPTGATEPCGALLAATDPQGLVTAYGYDRFGDLTQETDSSGKVTKSTYDEYGNVLTQTVSTPEDPDGVTTTTTYDAVGHPTSVRGPVVTNPVTGTPHQLTQSYTYNQDGVLTSASDADVSGDTVLSKRTTVYGVDARDRITTVTDNSVLTSKTAYNWAGQPAQTWDGDGNQDTYTYTAGGQLSKLTRTSAAGTTSVLQVNAYDPGGRLASRSDPMGRITHYTYTDNDLVKTEYTTTTSGAPSGSTRTITLHDYTYDQAGNVLDDSASSTTQPARTQATSYDDGNNPTSITLNPNGVDRVLSYTYNLDGQVTTTTRSGPDPSTGTRTETTSYGYGTTGALATQTAENGSEDLTTAYTDDAFGDVLTQTDPRGVKADGSIDPAYTTTATYDALARPSTNTAPPTATEDGTGATPTSQKARTTYGYDAFGDQTQVQEPNGQIITSNYDNFGHQVSQSSTATPGQHDAWTESWTYDPDGNVLTHTDRLGQTTTTTYDASGRILTETHPPATAGAAPGVDTYTWDDDGELLEHVDPTGAVTLNQYDDRGNNIDTYVEDRVPTSQVVHTARTFDDFGEQITEGDDASGVSSYATYDDAGEMLSLSQTDRGTTRWTYDIAGRVRTETDPTPTQTAPATTVTTTNTYDLAGRLTKRTQATASNLAGAPSTPSGTGDTAVTVLGPDDPASGVVGTGHGACTPTTGQDETPPAANTKKDLSGGGDPKMANSPFAGNRAWAYFNSGDGPVVTLADPQHLTGIGAEVYGSSDYEGEIYVVLDAPDGTYWEAWINRNDLGYGASGYSNVTVDDSVSYLTWTHYAANGDNIVDTWADSEQNGSIEGIAARVGATTGRIGWFLSCATDDSDALMGIDALAVTTTSGTTTYDLEAAAEQADLARTQTYGYDAAGNQTSSTDALGHTTTASYDARNELISTVDPAVNDANGKPLGAPSLTYGYDSVGDQTRQTDGDGHPTYTTYDYSGNPLTITAPSTTGQTGVAARTWTASYNAAGLPVSASEPDGVNLSMTYDALGDLTSQIGTTNGRQDATRTLTYDNDGRITSFNEPSGTATVNWDDRGLPVSVKHANGQSDTAAYDSLGRPTATTDASGTLTYRYVGANLNQVTDKTTGDVYKFGYDSVGHQISQSSFSGVDSAGAPIGLKESQSQTYDPLGRLDGQAYANASGTQVGNLSYTWDLDDRLTSQTTSGALLGANKPATDTINYSYDDAGRLITTNDTTSHTGTDYAWDAAGNRTSATTWTGTLTNKTTSTPATYTYDQRNRLVSAAGPDGATTYGYDQRGDRTSTTLNGATTTATFDAFGRMTTSADQGTHPITYDALDRMVGEANGDTLTYSGVGREPIAAGNWTLVRLSDGRALAERGPPGALNDLVSNMHGDVIAKLSGAGEPAATTSYDPFGAVTSTGTLGAPIGFQGSVTDPTTGQIHAGARWYDPSTGQFDSQDSAPSTPTTVASANLYTYGDASPINYSDPTGHFGWAAVLGFAGEVGEDVGLGALCVFGGCETTGAVAGSVAAGFGLWWAGNELVDALSASGAPTASSTATAVSGTASVGAVRSGAVTSAATQAPAANHVVTHAVAPMTYTCPAGYTLTSQKSCVSTAPPPPSITGTKVKTTSSTIATTRRWSDGQNDYLQTITTVTTVQHTTYTWSDGNTTRSTQSPQVSTTHSKVTSVPIIDLEHPLSFPAITQPVPTTPFAGNGEASASGVCGAGGSLASCDHESQTPMPGSPAEMAQEMGVSGSTSPNATPPDEPDEPDDKCDREAPPAGPLASNYRGRFNAAQAAKGGPRLPSDWDAHHRIPQMYRGHPDFAEFDFDDPANIRGVAGNRSGAGPANIHNQITQDWNRFAAENPCATGSQIEDFANRIDAAYEGFWWH